MYLSCCQISTILVPINCESAELNSSVRFICWLLSDSVNTSIICFFPNQLWNGFKRITPISYLAWVVALQNKCWSKKLSKITKHSNIALLLLLAGDICSNPEPLNFAFTNVKSLKSKYPSTDNFIQSNASDCFCRIET